MGIQYYNSYADAITKDGFYVYGNSIVPGQSARRTINTEKVVRSNSSTSWTSEFSETSTVRLSLYIYYTISTAYSGGNGLVRISYRKSGGGWTTYQTYTSGSGYKTFDITFSGSQIGSYQWMISVSLSNADTSWPAAVGAYIYWWESEFNGENIANGEVNWIAIEGGAPDPDDEN